MIEIVARARRTPDIDDGARHGVAERRMIERIDQQYGGRDGGNRTALFASLHGLMDACATVALLVWNLRERVGRAGCRPLTAGAGAGAGSSGPVTLVL